MPAYAIGHLTDVVMGPEILEYIQRIDETLAPFDGRFIIHGGEAEVKEGSWAGDLVVIAFPDAERLRAWYASPAYQAIQPLRARNANCTVVFLDGVPADH